MINRVVAREVCPNAAVRLRLLVAISGAIRRCHYSTCRNFPDYGGRGIEVCAEWLNDRIAFLRYLVTLDGHDAPGMLMDRIDNDRGYEPGNIRFATDTESVRNRRPVRRVPGGRQCRLNSQGIFGVTYVASRKKWTAKLVYRGRHLFLGRYDTPEEGSAVVLAKMAELGIAR